MPKELSKLKQEAYRAQNLALRRIESFVRENSLTDEAASQLRSLATIKQGRITQKEVNRLRDIRPTNWKVSLGRVIIPNEVNILPSQPSAPHATDVILDECRREIESWKDLSSVAEKYSEMLNDLINDKVAEYGRNETARRLQECNATQEIYTILHYAYDGPGPRDHFLRIVRALEGGELTPEQYEELSESLTVEEGPEAAETPDEPRDYRQAALDIVARLKAEKGISYIPHEKERNLIRNITTALELEYEDDDPDKRGTPYTRALTKARQMFSQLK